MDGSRDTSRIQKANAEEVVSYKVPGGNLITNIMRHRGVSDVCPSVPHSHIAQISNFCTVLASIYVDM